MKKFFLCWLCIPLFLQAAPKKQMWEFWNSSSESSELSVDHRAWSVFLDKYVEKRSEESMSLVKYSLVSELDHKALKVYIDNLSRLTITDYKRSEQLAYWINLYNAVTVDLVLDHYPVKSIKDIKLSGFFVSGPWKKKLLKIQGQELSLNDIEHRILRPIWNDARIHYAVNCASIGCPELQKEPFLPDNSEELLETAAYDYINSPRGVHFKKGKLVLSSIYSWFMEDFGGSEEEVLKHIGKYLDPSRELKGRISYDYNWNLNSY